MRSLLVLAPLVTAGLAGAAPASALIVQVGSSRLSYLPLHAPEANGAKSNAAKPVTYHGGPVMPSNSNYALYWDPSGAPEYPAGYEAGIDRYFEDLSHDSGGVQNTDSVLTQYGDSAGESANYDSHFVEALPDSDAYPANGCTAAATCLTSEQLRAELTSYVEAHGLPMDLEHEYFLLTPPGVESCMEAESKRCSAGTEHATFCSYHSYIPVGSQVIVYAEIPYMEGTNCDTGEEHPNGNASDATIGGGMAHEHAESVTDPELDAWYDAKGEEVADKCRTFKVATEFGEPLGKAPDGSNYNQLIDGDEYWYQQEWSNEAGACEQRAAVLPAVTKIAPKSGPASGGTSVTVTGSGFVGTVSVYFGAAKASEVRVTSQESLTATSPSASAGKVDVTVVTAAGTSPTTKKDRFTYKKAKKTK